MKATKSTKKPTYSLEFKQDAAKLLLEKGYSRQKEAKLSIIDYLAFYNGQRIHSTLGYKAPLIFEGGFLRQAA